MDLIRQLDVEKFLVFTLVLTRVSGLLMTAPIYGTKDIPARVRALLAMALAVLIMPSQWNTTLRDPGTTPMFLVLVGSELFIGACLGLGIMIVLSGIQMAGELMSRVGGLSMSEIFDPTFNDNSPLLSRLLGLICTAVFLAIGGHRILMAGLLDTFQTVQPGRGLAMILGPAQDTHMASLQSVVDMLILLVGESFSLGIRAAVPVVIAVLLATFVLGLISRTLPQLNVLMVGFGLNAMLMFAMLALSIGAIAVAFQEQLEPTLQTLFETLRIPIRSL